MGGFMAEKILKNRTQFTTTLKNELYDAMHELSIDTGVPKTKLLDRAVELLLKDMKKS
jgi:Ribbon-helix-helix domain